jgi:hypothetical protein
MKFMALYMAPAAATEEMMKTMTDADAQKEMAAWMAWGEKNKAAIVDMGAPLGKTKAVSASGVKDTRNDVNGYSVIEAESAEAAAKVFEGHPHLRMKGATIEIMGYVQLPGM